MCDYFTALKDHRYHKFFSNCTVKTFRINVANLRVD